MTDAPQDTQDTKDPPRTFTSFLMEQRQGGLHAELSDALAQVAQAVVEHGKKGALTLTVELSPTKNADPSVLLVTDSVKVKAPAGDRAGVIFFADEDGSLNRRDPRQPELPLREVPAAGEVREVAS